MHFLAMVVTGPGQDPEALLAPYNENDDDCWRWDEGAERLEWAGEGPGPKKGPRWDYYSPCTDPGSGRERLAALHGRPVEEALGPDMRPRGEDGRPCMPWALVLPDGTWLDPDLDWSDPEVLGLSWEERGRLLAESRAAFAEAFPGIAGPLCGTGCSAWFYDVHD